MQPRSPPVWPSAHSCFLGFLGHNFPTILPTPPIQPCSPPRLPSPSSWCWPPQAALVYIDPANAMLNGRTAASNARARLAKGAKAGRVISVKVAKAPKAVKAAKAATDSAEAKETGMFAAAASCPNGNPPNWPKVPSPPLHPLRCAPLSFSPCAVLRHSPPTSSTARHYACTCWNTHDCSAVRAQPFPHFTSLTSFRGHTAVFPETTRMYVLVSLDAYPLPLPTHHSHPNARHTPGSRQSPHFGIVL